MMMTPKSKIHARNTRAFTLVEVLIALAISASMGIALMFSYVNLVNVYDAISRMPMRNLDLATARNALLAEADYETAQRGDQFEGATGRQVVWSSLIEPTTTADLFLVTFNCQISGGEDAKAPDENITEIFRVLRPTWSQGTDSATLRAEARDRILQMLQPSPIGGIIGGDGVPSATAGKSGKSKSGSKTGPGGKAGTGKGNTGKGNTGKSSGSTGKGGQGGGQGGGNNYFNNPGNNPGKAGNKGGSTSGTGGGRRATKKQ